VRVAVVGGTGSLGKLVVRELAQRGGEVRALSRGGKGELPPGAAHSRVDLTTGEGLAEALDGVETVVNAVNDASRKAAAVLVDGERRLVAAQREAGVGHHVAISIVGCEQIPLAYYRAKVAQEQIVESGEIPWTLLRATQFHDLVAMLFGAAERLRVAPTGSARIQPIDPGVVARRLADAVHDGPAGRVPEIGGPRVETLTELSGAWRRQGDRRLLPLRVPFVGRAGRALRNGALCAPAAATAGPTFADWLAARRAS
jgi:uncharacterized protein YbjT (DUF2867 family)